MGPLGPPAPPGPPGPPGPVRKAALGTGTSQTGGRGPSGAGGAAVTSAERGRHSPLLTGRHPAPHAVHRALLPREGNLQLAALEILP